MASPIDVVDNPAEQRYEAVVDGVRARNLHVVPQCPFIAGYIDRHPDYRDLVAVD
jgi:predicted GNAT family acetyltransferase